MTVDVLSREVPSPLEPQNASHQHMLSLSGTCNLSQFPNMPVRFMVPWTPPLADDLGLVVPTARTRCSAELPLPAGDNMCLSATYCQENLSHRCVTLLWLSNAQRAVLRGLTLTGDGCQAAFTRVTSRYPCHAMYLFYILYLLSRLLYGSYPDRELNPVRWIESPES